MARPQTILVLTERFPRTVELPQVAQLGISERVRGIDGASNDKKEATVSLTASFGGSGITNLYTYSALVEAVPADIPKNQRDAKQLELNEKALKPLRNSAERLFTSFNNFLHSADEAPSLVTFDWFIESGRLDLYAAPERDAIPKTTAKGNLN